MKEKEYYFVFTDIGNEYPEFRAFSTREEVGFFVEDTKRIYSDSIDWNNIDKVNDCIHIIKGTRKPLEVVSVIQEMWVKE
jgi:hypothetical protein